MKSVVRLAAVAALVLTAIAAYADPSLTVGSPAPPIKVAKWIKGKAVDSFKKGSVYVVEFWATWCGPCKQSIPHLTDLAKKYSGKATFIGVSSFEKNAPLGEYASYGDKVAAFVKDFGPKMDYNVAWDGDAGVMAKTWMDAAGQGGIPTAFVVDRTGSVVWIGHPMAGLDEVVGQVVDGKFDVKAEAAKQARAHEASAKEQAFSESFMKPLRAGNYKEAVDALDKAIAERPEMETRLSYTRYMALAHYDPEAANAYALKIANGVYKDQPSMLNSLAWTMVDDQAGLKGTDVKVAIQIAEKCVALTKDEDPMAAYNLDTLAYCYFKDGQIDKAISLQEKALKLADAMKDFDAQTRKEIAGRLDQFKQKKNGGGGGG